MLDVETSKLIARKIKAKPGQCWKNAYLSLIELPGAFYVEGWAWDGIAFEHGWIELDGRIIDPTLYRDPPRGYVAANRYGLADLLPMLKANNYSLPVIWSCMDAGARGHYNQAQKQAFEDMERLKLGSD